MIKADYRAGATPPFLLVQSGGSYIFQVFFNLLPTCFVVGTRSCNSTFSANATLSPTERASLPAGKQDRGDVNFPLMADLGWIWDQIFRSC
jgi:hypothetical protein